MSFRKLSNNDNKEVKDECLLFYGFGEEISQTIKETSNKIAIPKIIGISIEIVEDKIKEMLSIDESITTVKDDVKVIIFNTNDIKLSAFIKLFRSKYKDPVIFAQINTKNREWKFNDLLVELKNERDKMEKYKNLK